VAQQRATPRSDRATARARPVDRVRGTHDLLPGDVGATSGLLRQLHETAIAWGYLPVEPPVLEHTELFLRKSGGDRVAQLYSFNHRGRDLALRPEFTAPVVRVFVEHLQDAPLPARLSYSGPVFRYEKPQAGRSRQFTEFGCELIGAIGPAADAETIGLALESLRVARVQRPRLVLGHIGIVINFLRALDIDQRAQDWLTWSMERLRKGDEAAHELPDYLQRVEAALVDDQPVVASDDPLTPEIAARLLRQAGVQFHGGVRTPEEIVAGLFAKQHRRYDVDLLRDAADFVAQLTRLTGPPHEVLEPLRALVAARGLDETPLEELAAIVRLLEGGGLDPQAVSIDLGMGRGLHYYTGMLFEVYGSNGGPQLCGGGRYDDLAQVLGARGTVPACGFSLGVERVLAAGHVVEVLSPARVLVLQDGDPVAAQRLATQLRHAGWIAAVDLRGRNLTATQRAAQRQGFAALARRSAAGVELLSVADGASMVFHELPSPDDVIYP
jgi:histidyl-tRNA synthetase